MLYVVLHQLRLPQHGPRVAIEDFSRLRRNRASGASGQQLHLELVLKLGDLLAERRLSGVQIGGRTGHAPQLDDPYEVLKLSKFHGSLYGASTGLW